MSRFFLIVVLMISIVGMCGCVQAVGKNLVKGATDALESKVIELRGEQYRKELAQALAVKDGEGKAVFSETDFDPNLDGTQDWEEYKAWQKKSQGYIFTDATKGLASGKSFEEVKERFLSLQQMLGYGSATGGGIFALLGLWWKRKTKAEIHKERDGTREETIKKVVNGTGNGAPALGGPDPVIPG